MTGTMTGRRGRVLVAFLVLLIGLLGACGQQTDNEPIPPFPGATVLDDEQNLIATSLRDALLEEQAAQGFEGEAVVYSLPSNTSFAEVEGFYDAELGGRNWTKESIQLPVPDGGAAGWSRGDNQSFVVLMLNDPLTRQILLVAVETRR